MTCIPLAYQPLRKEQSAVIHPVALSCADLELKKSDAAIRDLHTVYDLKSDFFKYSKPLRCSDKEKISVTAFYLFLCLFNKKATN